MERRAILRRSSQETQLPRRRPSDPLAEIIGRNLLRHRERCKISLEDAANRLGIDAVALAAYERGMRRAPPEIVYDASLLFDCLISDIMRGL